LKIAIHRALNAHSHYSPLSQLGDVTSDELHPTRGIWLLYDALPSDTASASLTITLPTDAAVVAPLAVFWVDNTTWPADPSSLDELPGTTNALPLAEISFNASHLSDSVDIGIVALLRRRFTLLVVMSPNAFSVDDMTVDSVQLSTVANSASVAQIAARCVGAITCDACSARGDLCGFCDGSCRFGWRDGPIGGGMCSSTWSYATCDATDRFYLAPLDECETGGVSTRFRFDLTPVLARAISSASFQISSLVSPFRGHPLSIIYAVGYQRTARGLDLNGSVCDIELTNERYELGTTTYAQLFAGDAGDAVRNLVRNGERSLIVEVRPEYFNGEQAAFQFVRSAERLRPRNSPRLRINVLPVGSTQPAAACDAATSCDACTALPHCGWCGSSGRCVNGNSTAPTGGVLCASGYAAVTCAASSRIVLPARIDASCVVPSVRSNDPPVPSGVPQAHADVVGSDASMILSFDLRPLRSVLASLSNGAARRITGASLQFRARHPDNEVPANVMANAVWIIGDSICAQATTPSSAVVMARAAVKYANSTTQPLAIPLSVLPIAVDAVASALYADTLQLRVSVGGGAARVWFALAANDDERLSPQLVIDLARQTALTADSCASVTNRTTCLTTANCGWCTGVASRAGAPGCVSGTPQTALDTTECAAANYVYADTTESAGVTVQMQTVDAVARDIAWLNMPSLEVAALEATLTVPATLQSSRVASATLAFRFVRGALREGDVVYADESAIAIAKNNSVLATVRMARASRFDAPLRVAVSSQGFQIDVSDALRAAAESSERTLVVRISGNAAQTDLDVRVFTSFDYDARRRATLSVVTSADAVDVANAACVVNTNCSACAAVESCGWCVSDMATGAGTCVAGTAQRPLFARACAAWSYSACLTTGMIALYTPLACSNNGQVIVDSAPINELYVPPFSPRNAIQPRSQLRIFSHHVVTVDLTALRVGGRGAVSLQAPIRLRLFAAQPLVGVDFTGLPAPTMVAWSLLSSGSKNVSSADCAAIAATVVDERAAISRTPITRELNTGDSIDLDVSAAFANVSTTDMYVRIAFTVPTTTLLEVVAPGNCARARFRPMLVARTPQLTRSAVALRRTIVDDCAFDGGLYNDATTGVDVPPGRRDISVAAAQQWRAGDAASGAAQSLDNITESLRDALPRVVDVTTLAFVGANATLVSFVGSPTLGRFDLVRVSDSLNVSTPIRLVLVVDADSTPTGTASIALVRAASLRGLAPTVAVDPIVVGNNAQCVDVAATAQVNANATLTARLVVEHFPRARLADMQRVSARDSGGETVVLRGTGFVTPAPDPRSSATGPVRCYFYSASSGESFVANATVLNDTAVSCGPLPPIDIGLVRSGVISLSWDGGICTTTTVAAFDVASDCTNVCSGHGQCRLQECVCVDPYRGDNCERVVQRLVVAPVPNATIDDGQPYSVQINVINGSAPITAVPFALPDGAVWNAQNRSLVWARAVGRMRPYELVVRVSNELDSVTLSWFVTVRRTIAVGINVTQADRQRLPLAVGERLDLRVQTTPVTAGVVASIMAQSNGSDAWYELGAGEHGAVVSFAPTAAQVGVTVFAATRAGDDADEVPQNERLSVEVVHVQFGAPSLPEIVLAAGQKRALSNFVTLTNPSKRALTDVVVIVSAQHATATVPVLRIGTLAAGASQAVSFELTPSSTNSSVTLDSVVLAARSLERASALLTVTARIVSRLGALVLVDGRALKASVPFDEPRLVTFAIRNAAPIVARDITVELGAASSLFSVVAGRYTSDLEVNGTLTVTLRVLVASPPTTTRTLTGAISVRGDEGAFVSVPYEITATASPYGTLRVVPEDQATYYGGGVLVPGASARLFDTNGVLVRAFNASQSAVAPELLAENVTEGNYELRVEAPGRAPARELITVQRGVVNRVTVFLARSLVSYVWRVVPTGYNDEYTFVLDFAFETNVPAPVLAVSPNTLRVEQWCDAAVLAASTGDTFVVNFNVTNHGLIRAEKVRFDFPTTNALVSFEKLVDIPSSIEARQSVIVPVAVRARPNLLTCRYPRGDDAMARKRQAFSGCEVALVVWSIECAGEKVTVESLGIEVDGLLPCPGRAGPLPRVPPGDGGGNLGGSIGEDVGGGRASLCKLDTGDTPQQECEDLLKDAALDCSAAIIPPVAWAKAVREAYKWYEERDVVGAAESGVEAIESAGETASPFARVLDCLKSLFETRKCEKEDLKRILHRLPHRKRNVDAQLRAEVEADMIAYMAEVELINEGLALLVGRDFFVSAMLSGGAGADAVWFRSLANALKSAMRLPSQPSMGLTLDDALLGMFGATKLAQLRGNGYSPTRRAVLERLAMAVAYPNATVLPAGFDSTLRINLTELASIGNSVIASYDFAANAGHTSPLSGLAARRSELIAIEARRAEGVCAVVKVRIEQRVSLTRTVFEASLVIDNSAVEALSGVAVELAVLDAARRPVSLTVFNVTRRAAPLLDAANATLAPGAQAELVWLLAPQDNAAPREPTTYFVGGALRYRIGADPQTSIELLPERIVVHPNPRLRFDYFLERRVLSDDPFTDDIVEPSVPFALGVLVSNDGFGVAQNMSVSSSQPKIVENRRGLLVDFAIVSARANDAAVQASLLVPLGDIGAQSSASALWTLTATLQGEFTEFNASFRHQSAVSDGPQLTSIVESVKTHRLTRAVTLPSTGRVAFLADDVLDVDALPDTLYSGRLSEPVARLQLADEAAVAPLYNAATQTLTLTTIASQLTASQPSARFYYVRLVDPLGSNSSVAVVGATSVVGNVSAIDAWRERYTERLVNQAPRDVRWLHLFANASDGFVWRLRTVVLPSALTVRVVNATATSGVAVWENGGDVPVDIEYRRVAANATVVAAASWRGAARFVLGDLAPDTEYELIVTPVRDSAARGTPAKTRFRTLSIDAARTMCAMTNDAATCNATIAVAVAPVTCANASVCENGGQLGANCACVCRDLFSGARCHLCETASLQCVNGVAGVLDGKCACACTAGWSGARCDQVALQTDGCASAVLATTPSRIDAKLCFEFPRPSAARIVSATTTSNAVVAFNASSEFANVVAVVTVSGLAVGSTHTLLVWDGLAWVDAATTCQPRVATAVSVGGLLRQPVCALGAFAVVPQIRPTTVMLPPSTTETTTTETAPESSSTTGLQSTTAAATTAMMSLMTNGTAAPSSKAGLIGGLVAAALCCAVVWCWACCSSCDVRSSKKRRTRTKKMSRMSCNIAKWKQRRPKMKCTPKRRKTKRKRKNQKKKKRRNKRKRNQRKKQRVNDNYFRQDETNDEF
jgi:hypothetical protein